jgi:hypothetical protein
MALSHSLEQASNRMRRESGGVDGFSNTAFLIGGFLFPGHSEWTGRKIESRVGNTWALTLDFFQTRRELPRLGRSELQLLRSCVPYKEPTDAI